MSGAAGPTLSVNNATICSGTSTVLTASGANTYNWSNGVMTASTSVSPPSTTIYTVTGTNTLTGCGASKTATVTVNATPTVAVSNATICAGTSTVLTASGATTYSWNTGPTTNTISANPSTTTIYTVTGTTNNCNNTKTVAVTVTSNPTVSVSNATICSGASVTLTASGATSYSWNTGPTTNTISVSPGTTTIYTVTGVTNGCSNTKTVSVTVNPTPTVTASNATVCAGSSTVITASGASTYSWNTGVTTASISLSPTVTTIYTVTGTSSLSCSNIKTVSVTVIPLPTITITPASTICAGQSKTLTATGATTYTWSTGPTTSSIVVTPTVNTSYTVSGTTSGCIGSAVTSVSVFTNPVLSVSASPTIVCLSTSTLTAGGATTYSWSTSSTTNTTAVTPTVTTIYTVTGTTSGCSSTKTISVAYGPTAPIISISSNTAIGCGGSTTLTASGGASYTWTPGGATTSTIAVTTSVVTVYTITSTFGGSCGTGTTAVVINPNTSTLCCSSSNTTMGTSLTSTLSIAGTYSGTVIDVKGTLLSAGSVTFTGCTLRMSKGARIVMSPDDDLTLINCKLFSCSELWDGIYFQTFLGKIGNITVNSGSTIEDMYNGIVMDYDGFAVPATPVCGNITIDQSMLNKNYVSIQMKNSTGVSPGSVYGLAMTSSTISSNASTTSPGSTLKPSSTYTYAYNTITNGTTGNSAPYLNFPRAYTGIILQNLGTTDEVQVGDNVSSSYTNTFDNLDFGVNGAQVQLAVRNNYFKNITGSFKSEDISHGGGFPATGPDEIGIAVALTHTATGYDVTVGTSTVLPSSGNPYPLGNVFENCNKGIKSNNVKLYAKGNVFTSASTDIPVVTTTGSPPMLINNPNTYYYYKAQNAVWMVGYAAYSEIYANYIRNHNTGIYGAPTSTGSIEVNVIGNDIAAPSATGYCKKAIEVAQISGRIDAVISYNTIENVYNGVTASGVNAGDLKIRNNSISVESTVKTYNHGATAFRTGIAVNNCQYAQIQGNTLTSNAATTPSTSATANYLNGIFLTGSTLGETECNSATKLGRCFVFQGTCDHSWLANTMSDSYTGMEIRTLGRIGVQGAPTGTPNLSANTWTTITQETNILSSAGNNTISPLYVVANAGSPKTQPTLNFGTAGHTYSTAINQGIRVLASGTSYTCNSNGNAQRMASGNSGTKGNTTHQRSAGEETDSLANFMSLAASDENTYDVLTDEFIYRNKQLVYKLIKEDSIQVTQGSTLDNFYTATQGTAIDQLTNVQMALAANDLSTAGSANASVAYTNSVEQKHQRANELILKYLGDHSYHYTADERQELTAMANECMVKGYYVTQARNVINIITGRIAEYDDDCEIESNNSRKAQITDPVTQTSFNLFPNPNNGSMQMEYDLASYSTATMNVYDVTGKLVKSYKLENTKGTLQINEQTLHNGAYFYHILVNGKSIKNDKIIVIK